MPGRRPVRRRKSVSHYTDDNPSTFTVKRKRGERPVVAAPKRVRNSSSSSSNSNINSKIPQSSTQLPSSPSRKRKRHRIRVLHDDPPTAADEILAHAVAIQPVVHVPQHSAVAAPTTTTLNTLTTSPPPTSTWKKMPSAYRGPLLRRLGAGGTQVHVPPPAVTAWTCRADGAFAVGDCAGGVTLYSSKNQAVTLLRTTAWKREQQRPLVSKKVVSWPNAVTHVGWRGHLLVYMTAVELEVWSLLPSSSSSLNSNNINSSKKPLATFVLNAPPPNTSKVPHLDVLPSTFSNKNENNNDHGYVLWTTAERTLAEEGVTTAANKPTSVVAEENKNDGDDEPNNHNDEKTNHSLPSLVRIHVTKQTPSADTTTTTQVNSTSQVVSMLDSFHSYTAIWDNTPSSPQNNENANNTSTNDPVALLVARTSETRVDLIRLATTSQTIQQQVPLWDIPNNMAATHAKMNVVRLQQSQEYTFLLGGFSKTGGSGIRMLDSHTLTTLQVFGASVALHGKTVQWQSCQWVRAPAALGNSNYCSGGGGSKNTKHKKKQTWVEQADALADTKAKNYNNNKNAGEDYWLIGLPHAFKGPDELRSTLYVWNAAGLEVTTLPGPQHGDGCLGLVCQDRDDRGWELVGASAETGELWEWRPSLKSNFAGVMYPVAYQVIENNIEYIEDEDELDERIVLLPEEDDDDNDEHVVVHQYRSPGKRSKTAEDEEALNEALKLSLLEQPTQEEIQVLPEQDEDESLFIPCYPDRALVSNTDETAEHAAAATTQSPEPSRKDGFESDVLLALPQTRLVRQHHRRRKAQQDTLARQSRETADDVVVPPVGPPRIKGKRTKVANVEALLQASIKPELRRRMEETQVFGGGGVVVVNNGRSDEEKELALELLLLSPGSKKKTFEFPDVDQQPLPTLGSKEKDAKKELDPVVTPSDGDASIGSKDREDSTEAAKKKKKCPACRGRMVLHTCGKRDKPIDYEAIERAERERKAKIAEEKHKARQAKRRAADARRREARKKKKEEEERKRQEEEQKRREQEERMRRLEADQFERAHIREHEEEPLQARRTPASAYQAAYDPTSSSHGDFYGGSTTTDGGYASQRGWSSQQQQHHLHHRRGSGQAPSESYSNVSSTTSTRQEPLRIDGTEVQPSTSLKASDALAALAGLADSMPVAPPAPSTADSTRDAFPPAPASWYSSTEPETPAAAQQDTGTSFVYQGSQERRAAIAQAFLGSLEIGSNGKGNAYQQYSTTSTTPHPATNTPSEGYGGVQQEAYNGGVQQDAYNCIQQQAYNGVQAYDTGGAPPPSASRTEPTATHPYGSHDAT